MAAGVPGSVPGGSPSERARAGEQEKQQKRARGQRPALLARFPRFFWNPPADGKWPQDWPVVSEDNLEEYPALADDLAVWTEELEPRFRKLDHQAQILQNQFWQQNVALIVGGLLATSLGAVQAAVGGGVVALAVTQALLAGLLAGLTVMIRSRRAQRGYLTDRLKAEQIKSEYFFFLPRAGDYAAADRAARLKHQVGVIESAEGVA
jgi:Protein of unknown function (DUF4231)